MKHEKDGDIRICEYRMKHAGGSWRILRSQDVVFLRNEQGEGEQILGSAEDITERKQAEVMENAVRHGGEITRVLIFSREYRNALIIICEDDGIGISSEEKDLIFDHGYGKHTGIGLFLAREILSSTELSIRECGDPGKGARFEILVPAGKFREKGKY
ncbi:MAG TPA: ATP-binding protein [Methanospirillum sp.]|nr:ATP-binding protein [Methanospirillum sp.]